MAYRLGLKSKFNLRGVKPQLVRVVERAIEISEVDFSAFEGLRTIERQRKYVAAGVSKTMASKHITGEAVDNVPYIDGQLRWEWKPIFAIAVAMDQAAAELKVRLRWGGVWDKTMDQYGGSAASMEKEVAAYVARETKRQRDAGREHPAVFLDGPHFELA